MNIEKAIESLQNIVEYWTCWQSEVEAANIAITALREQQQREQGCEYVIYVPSENGYDVEGKYYECSCGANYIEIEGATEWTHCPYCGNEIQSKETYPCIDCAYAEYDGDSYYCGCDKSKCCGENVDDACFDGCKFYTSRGRDLRKAVQG